MAELTEAQFEELTVRCLVDLAIQNEDVKNVRTFAVAEEDGSTWEVTVQRVGGKTPAERLLELEAELESKVTQLQQMLRYAVGANYSPFLSDYNEDYLECNACGNDWRDYPDPQPQRHYDNCPLKEIAEYLESLEKNLEGGLSSSQDNGQESEFASSGGERVG